MATPVTALTTSVRDTAASIVAIIAPDYGEIAQELFEGSDAKALCDAAAITDRALALGRDHAVARELRRARNREQCEHESASVRDLNEVPIDPCWKRYVDATPHSEGGALPRQEWCEPCLRRQDFHDRMVAAKRRRASGLRWLEAMASRHPSIEQGGAQ